MRGPLARPGRVQGLSLMFPRPRGLKVLPMSTSSSSAVLLSGIHKTYGKGDGAVSALRDVSLEFSTASFTAVMGPSGSGKSTFLHVAAGLDAPTKGSVQLGGVELAGLSQTALTVLRRERVGFVFQSFNLMPSL